MRDQIVVVFGVVGEAEEVEAGVEAGDVDVGKLIKILLCSEVLDVVYYPQSSSV